MTKPVKDRKRLSQRSIDRLVAVYELALKEGYGEDEAMALAVGALERYHAGGYRDFAKKIRAIQRHGASVGNHQAATYKRLTEGRKREKYVDLQARGPHWAPACACDWDRAD